MMVRIDKRLFEILNEMGARVDRETFLAAYAQRKAEREKDPRLIRQRRLNQQVNDMMSAMYFSGKDG